MSKNLKLIVIILLIVILTGVIKWLITKKNLEYSIIKDGYSSYKSKIISNYQEYIEFVDYIDSQNKAYGKVFKFNSNKYNEQYFKTKSIAIINIITGSGMNKLKSIDFSISNNTLICTVDIHRPKGGAVTDDIKGKVYLVEIDKSVTNFKIEK